MYLYIIFVLFIVHFWTSRSSSVVVLSLNIYLHSIFLSPLYMQPLVWQKPFPASPNQSHEETSHIPVTTIICKSESVLAPLREPGSSPSPLCTGGEPHLPATRGGLLFTRPSETRDLLLGDDALLYIAYVILIWAAPIPATRCHYSLRP